MIFVAILAEISNCLRLLVTHVAYVTHPQVIWGCRQLGSAHRPTSWRVVPVPTGALEVDEWSIKGSYWITVNKQQTTQYINILSYYSIEYFSLGNTGELQRSKGGSMESSWCVVCCSNFVLFVVCIRHMTCLYDVKLSCLYCCSYCLILFPVLTTVHSDPLTSQPHDQLPELWTREATGRLALS